MNNKNIIVKLIMALLIITITSMSVYALDTSKLLAYYNFDESFNITTPAVDSIYGQNLTRTTATVSQSVAGKVNTAWRHNSGYQANLTSGFDNLPEGFSINTWVKYNITYSTGRAYPFYFTPQKAGAVGDLQMIYYPSPPNYYINNWWNSTGLFERFVGTAINQNTWVMLTVVYNGTSGEFKYYENRDLIASTILNKSFGQNHSKYTTLTLTTTGTIEHPAGQHYYTLDEYLIYNGTLSTADITLLYNNGFGIDLSNLTVPNITVENVSGCINDNTYCTAIYMLGNTPHCAYENTVYCATGCANGQCNDQVCESECQIIGAKQCDSSTSYTICQDSNSDGCLENTTGNFCAIGEYCRPSGNYFATCEPVSSFGTGNNTAFVVIPYTTNSDNTTYVNDANNKVLAVNTKNGIHVQWFQTMAQLASYSSRTCAYTETTLFNTVSNTIITNQTTINTPPTAVTSFINIVFTPEDNTPLRISILDALNTNMKSVDVLRNVSSKSVCINLLNGTNIYCDYSTNVYDDLTNVDMTVYFDFVSQSETMKILFNRATDNIVSTLPQLFVGNDVSKIIFNSTNATINGITLKSYTQPNGFTATLSDDITYLPCLYSNIGSYSVRTYNNNNGQPDYTNFYDYTINIKSLSNAGATGNFDQNTQNFVDRTFGTGLSVGEKLFWVMVVTFIALILVIILGMYADMPPALTGGLSVIVVLTSLIMFAFLGFIPVWIIILIGIIGAGVVAMFFKGMVAT